MILGPILAPLGSGHFVPDPHHPLTKQPERMRESNHNDHWCLLRPRSRPDLLASHEEQLNNQSSRFPVQEDRLYHPGLDRRWHRHMLAHLCFPSVIQCVDRARAKPKAPAAPKNDDRDRRTKEGNRDRGSQRLGPTTLVQARRVAAARRVPFVRNEIEDGSGVCLPAIPPRLLADADAGAVAAETPRPSRVRKRQRPVRSEGVAVIFGRSTIAI